MIETNHFRSAVRPLVVAVFGLLFCLTACQSTGASGDEVSSYVRVADGTLLHYRKIGSGEQVVIVPGANFLGQDLDRLANGRTLIFYDMRGRGRSDRVRTVRLETDIDDLEQIRAWFGIERCSLLGFDYGGALVSHYAARNPERVDRLVIVSPIPIRRHPYWDIYERVNRDRIDKDGLQALHDLRREHAARLEPEKWSSAYKETMLSGWVTSPGVLRQMKSPVLAEPNNDPEKLHRQYLSLLRALDDWDWREVFSKISCPTLLICGASDPVPVESSREWATAIPASSTVEIREAARLPWLERPADFVEAADGFLRAATR